jgi:hypothetical protein
MPARKPRPIDERPQFERFLETARKIGAAETDDGLENILRKVVRPKTSIEAAPASPRSTSKKGRS